MTASWAAPVAESRSSTGELAAIIDRWRAKREQRRREQKEFKAWLEITRSPLW
jgi:hypothetical protein